MNSPENQLAAALRERLALIADEGSRRDPEHHVKKLKTVSEKIVALQKKLPRTDRSGTRTFPCAL